jgi:hypothetical protein
MLKYISGYSLSIFLTTALTTLTQTSGPKKRIEPIFLKVVFGTGLRRIRPTKSRNLPTTNITKAKTLGTGELKRNFDKFRNDFIISQSIVDVVMISV